MFHLPVHEADVIEVLAAVAAEGELGEGGGCGCASTVAFHLTGAAVAGGACTTAGAVEGAARPAPEPARPARRGLERARAALGQLESGSFKNRASGI